MLHYKLLTAMDVGNPYYRACPEEGGWNRFAMQNDIKVVLLLCLEVPKECPKSPRCAGYSAPLSHNT